MMIEMRKLKTDDIFPTLKIINKIGLEEIKNNLDSEKISKIMEANRDTNKEDRIYAVGASVAFELAQTIIKNIPCCKDDIYDLFAGLTGMSNEEIGNMDLIPFTEMVVEFFKKEEFKDFIKVVSTFIK